MRREQVRLRWDFKARIRASDDFIKARVDSSNELISSSIACRRWSQDSGEVSMKVIAGVDMVLPVKGITVSSDLEFEPPRAKERCRVDLRSESPSRANHRTVNINITRRLHIITCIMMDVGVSIVYCSYKLNNGDINSRLCMLP